MKDMKVHLHASSWMEGCLFKDLGVGAPQEIQNV
jgi:hypothetical protein